MRFGKGREPKPHVVSVLDVRPLPDGPDVFEPYFVALCTCDKLGPDVRDNEADARNDANLHGEQTGGTVELYLSRPVG